MRFAAALLAAFATPLFISGCASSPAPGTVADQTSVQEADDRMVEDCEFLGTVVGKSGWGGLATETARKGATRSAMKRAAALGATHIVLDDFKVGSGVPMQATTLQGRAYRCDVDGEYD